MSVEKLNALKVRVYDLQESLDERKAFESQFFGELADLLGLPEDNRSNPGVYLQAVSELKLKASAEVEVTEEEIKEE